MLKIETKISISMIALRLGAIFFIASVVDCGAFALVGPVQPWMQTPNKLIQPGAIGGPMSLGSGYRWNVPVVTYGFDQSFLSFFGSNGVTAVESAIQIINDLPPASQIVLTNYPLLAEQTSASTPTQTLKDLKSHTLSLLLQELGLAPPTGYVYCIKTWDETLSGESLFLPWYNADTNDPAFYLIAHLNYDPETLTPTPYINNNMYGAQVYTYNAPVKFYGVSTFPGNPFGPTTTSVADNDLYMYNGFFFAGLTYDDVGGLRYQFSTNNIFYETLLSGVHGIGTNSFVNGAWRPGIDKISFVRHPTDSIPTAFVPMTNCFIDTYFTNGNAVRQQLQRVIVHPDFVFSAGNETVYTGTTNWINNAAFNNNLTGEGPGTINPPIKIVFQKLGSQFYSLPPYLTGTTWSEELVLDITSDMGIYGSFDGSTNTPIVYPEPTTGNNSMTVLVKLKHFNSRSADFVSFELSTTSQAGKVYSLQTSTNFANWLTLFQVTNNGSVCNYQNVNANSGARFYRLIPQ